MPEIHELFKAMKSKEASDLHLTSNEVPMVRIHADLQPLAGADKIPAETMKTLLFEIIPSLNKEEFEKDGDTDFAYFAEGVGRYRVSYFQERCGPGAVFRLIPERIPSAEELNLPKSVLDLCFLTRGLVLLTGPAGCGKSTTMATMVDYVNQNREDHVITIEDPIEFVHTNNSCLVNQREFRRHTQSFKRALRAALREDPDIVMIGELRDLETFEIALETAETGHLVFGSLHTTTAAATVDRIINQFPADRQSQIRVMLSGSLKGVISQVLCKKVDKGRLAAMEILLVNPAIATAIRESKTYQIPSSIQVGAKQGMRLMNDALLELVRKKLVDPEEALNKAANREEMLEKLQTAGIPVTVPAHESSNGKPAVDGSPVKPALNPASHY